MHLYIYDKDASELAVVEAWVWVSETREYLRVSLSHDLRAYIYPNETLIVIIIPLCFFRLQFP